MTYDQFLLKRRVSEDQESVSLNSVIEEFEVIWKKINSIIEFPDIRRIGLVAEHRIDNNGKNCTPALVDSLTKFKKMAHGAHFRLSFDEKKIPRDDKLTDFETIDYINVIKTIYDSSLDQSFPEKNKYNLNIDVQRYFNPACGNPIKELNELKKTFNIERTAFIQFLNERGLGE
jgi:hypothetical protein